MNKPASFWIDIGVFTVANLMNVIMVGVFIARTMKTGHSPAVSAIWIIFIIILIVAAIFNVREKRNWWTFVLPAILALFLVAEVVLDYILQIDFRNTKLLGPYLVLYYAGILGLIGYSFQIEKKYGFITLVTYFLSQAAALYSYLQVGHG